MWRRLGENEAGALRSTIRHLRSRRALTLVLAAALGLTSLFLPSPWAEIAAVVAIVAYTSLLLQMSTRITELRSSTQRLRKELRWHEKRRAEPEQKEQGPDMRPGRRLAFAIDALRSPVTDLTDGAEILAGESSPDRPLVTVVVPCHNEERFVADTLASVAAQSFEDWECIVVDDASSDGSLATIWAAIDGDRRFRVLRHVVNGGLSAARNTGLRAARGRFITFLDSDDLILEDSLLDRVASLVNGLGDPHVIGSYSDVKVDVEDVTLDDYPNRLGRLKDGVIDLVSADSECPFPAHGPLLLTQKLRDLGGFDEGMRHGAEDWDLWYRAMRNGYVFIPSAYRTIVYRQKRGSMVRAMGHLHLDEANRLITAAHRDVDPGVIRHPSPTPLPRSLGHYQSMIRRADRAVRFAAMSLIAGQPEAALEALDVFGEAPRPLLERHLDMLDLIDRGIQRALSLSPQDFSVIETAADRLRRQLYSLIDQAAASFHPEPFRPHEPPEVGALLVPQHGGQLTAMIAAAREHGYEPSATAVLMLEREIGPQGVSAELPDEMSTWSLNSWVFSEGKAETVMVGPVPQGAVRLLAETVAAPGGKVIEVAQPGDELMRLDEAAQPLEPTPNGRGLVGLGSPDGARSPYEPSEAWWVEEYPGTEFDPPAMARFRDRHRGQRVVIIGNGPSLNKQDLSLLSGEHTIAVNGIFYARDRMGFDPTYYVVEDTAFMRDNVEAIRGYRAGHKFFPSIYRDLIGDSPDVTYFMMNRGFYERRSLDFCVPRFATDASQRVYSGQSVTIINLQLAYHLGFDEVVLIGMDFSYTVPEGAIVEGDLVTSTGDDPNHFHPDYFGAGKVWKDPKLDRVLANYALAKRVFEADGRRIVNATHGGKLELFDRVGFEQLFR